MFHVYTLYNFLQLPVPEIVDFEVLLYFPWTLDFLITAIKYVLFVFILMTCFRTSLHTWKSLLLLYSLDYYIYFNYTNT